MKRVIDYKDAMVMLALSIIVFSCIAYFDPAVSAGHIANFAWSTFLGFTMLFILTGKKVDK